MGERDISISAPVDRGITTTGALARQLDRDQPADKAAGTQEVTAEWALWGKEANESAYRVLRCSEGIFGPDDFNGIIARYASGAKETLPQYTVCWIPAKGGGQGHLAVGIHELAHPDPRRSGGRARTAGGREIEYVRLFCVRYPELAALGVAYSELVEALREHQLPASLTSPIRVRLPETELPSVPAARRELAENIAALLLTTRPVCVLGADAATAQERLLIIDRAMSLLPYGLRTTLSASTWASSTAQDLKLRLFFANAKRDDRGRTSYLTWDQPEKPGLSAAEDEAPLLYLSWLRQVGSDAAAALLLEQTGPARFDRAEIRQMVANLPQDRPVADTLEELAEDLLRGDRHAVKAALERLKRDLGRQPGPDERQAYRRMIARLGLLKDHPVHHATKASVYRVLLSLAFEAPLLYTSYCEIEDAVGGPPRGPLRSVLLKLKFSTFLPYVLVAKAEPNITDEALMDVLDEHGITETAALGVLQREIGNLRPAHRQVVYDFVVRYLRAYAEDARTELVRRGYLADTLEAVFPGDLRSQRIRLEEALQFVYGPQLRKGQIVELFADPGLRPTMALETAVAHLAGSHRAGRFVEQQAAYARLQRAGHSHDAQVVRQAGARRLSRLPAPDMIGAFPRRTVQGAAFVAAVIVIILILMLTHTYL